MMGTNLAKSEFYINGNFSLNVHLIMHLRRLMAIDNYYFGASCIYAGFVPAISPMNFFFSFAWRSNDAPSNSTIKWK